MITNSQKIEKIICFLESIKCKVIRHSNELPDDVSGRCIYTKSEIHLNCLSSEEALYTILHESEHWVSYIRLFVQQGKKQSDVSVREKLAYLYDWFVIKHLELGISKN